MSYLYYLQPTRWILKSYAIPNISSQKPVQKPEKRLFSTMRENNSNKHQMGLRFEQYYHYAHYKKYYLL